MRVPLMRIPAARVLALALAALLLAPGAAVAGDDPAEQGLAPSGPTGSAAPLITFVRPRLDRESSLREPNTGSTAMPPRTAR